ncbi:nitrate reductase molybdenum cofactor assembly chaperone [uncultured Arthrobacter sp.]|uniref:nitrate reductase molybdenum cofactor assembly chaperone n=1 Tax=uncultured Arthrobacter sp. TaxID=114050 RepID=UPI00260A5EBD|nr:nitrate reductase molybdenum cofactor assembly chaperone [uncultured Arthrobacter sp.]
MGVLEKLLGKAGPGTVDPGIYTDTDPRRSAVIRQATALLLGYPDHQLLTMLPTLRAALEEVRAPVEEIEELLDWFTARPLEQVQSDYVQEFDLSRRHSLHLTYWTDGDTRRRGEALAAFKEIYRSHGADPEESELPDYLPLVLEFAARISPEDGYELLQRYRPSLELLRLALRDDHLPYRGAVALVCSTLPGVSPEDRDAVMRMAGYGPPTESVGLDPYDPRLLPVSRRSTP